MCTPSNLIAPHVGSSATYTLIAVKPYYGQVMSSHGFILISIVIYLMYSGTS